MQYPQQKTATQERTSTKHTLTYPTTKIIVSSERINGSHWVKETTKGKQTVKSIQRNTIVQ